MVLVSTLLSLLVSLLHGHQGGEVGLIVGQYQRRTVTAVGRNLQWQVKPSKRNGGKSCKVSTTKMVEVHSKW